MRVFFYSEVATKWKQAKTQFFCLILPLRAKIPIRKFFEAGFQGFLSIRMPSTFIFWTGMAWRPAHPILSCYHLESKFLFQKPMYSHFVIALKVPQECCGTLPEIRKNMASFLTEKSGFLDKKFLFLDEMLFSCWRKSLIKFSKKNPPEKWVTALPFHSSPHEFGLQRIQRWKWKNVLADSHFSNMSQNRKFFAEKAELFWPYSRKIAAIYINFVNIFKNLFELTDFCAQSLWSSIQP